MEVTVLQGYVVETCRYLILFTMCLAALGKLTTFRQFRDNLTQGFTIPQRWTAVLAIGVIVSELLIVVLLLLPFARVEAMLMAAVMLTMFTLVLLSVVVKDRLVRCNCFGSNNEIIGVSDVVRNLFLLLACAGYLWLQTGHSQRLPWHAHMLLCLLALMLFMLLSNLKTFVLLRRNPKGAQSG